MYSTSTVLKYRQRWTVRDREGRRIRGRGWEEVVVDLVSMEEEEEDIFSALPTLYTDIDYLT